MAYITYILDTVSTLDNIEAERDLDTIDVAVYRDTHTDPLGELYSSLPDSLCRATKFKQFSVGDDKITLTLSLIANSGRYIVTPELERTEFFLNAKIEYYSQLNQHTDTNITTDLSETETEYILSIEYEDLLQHTTNPWATLRAATTHISCQNQTITYTFDKQLSDPDGSITDEFLLAIDDELSQAQSSVLKTIPLTCPFCEHDTLQYVWEISLYLHCTDCGGHIYCDARTVQSELDMSDAGLGTPYKPIYELQSAFPQKLAEIDCVRAVDPTKITNKTYRDNAYTLSSGEPQYSLLPPSQFPDPSDNIELGTHIFVDRQGYTLGLDMTDDSTIFYTSKQYTLCGCCLEYTEGHSMIDGLFYGVGVPEENSLEEPVFYPVCDSCVSKIEEYYNKLLRKYSEKIVTRNI